MNNSKIKENNNKVTMVGQCMKRAINNSSTRSNSKTATTIANQTMNKMNRTHPMITTTTTTTSTTTI